MFLTESLQKKRYGWSSGSKMPGRYEHMMNSDVEEAIFKHYGISNTKNEDLVSRPKICKICNIPNSYDSKMCSKCGKPLDLKIALENEEKNETERQNMKKELDYIKENMEKIISEKFKQHSTKLLKGLEKIMENSSKKVQMKMERGDIELLKKMSKDDLELAKMKDCYFHPEK
jgi:hypothetical protein